MCFGLLLETEKTNSSGQGIELHGNPQKNRLDSAFGDAGVSPSLFLLLSLPGYSMMYCVAQAAFKPQILFLPQPPRC